jgi:hypothetical protein
MQKYLAYKESQIEKYPISAEGISLLLKKIVCLQCRVILLEWGLAI